MRPVLVLVLVALSACGRPLAPPERAFLTAVSAPNPDLDRMRLSGGYRPGLHPFPPPRRDTCQNRIFPPVEGPVAYGATPAFTLYNTVIVREGVFSEDLTGGDYPAVLDLARGMLLAHEATHVWQWQNRKVTGYSPLKAALEHVGREDPYLFDPDTRADFLSFAYEQQGAIVEEYLCCRVLAPDAERTRRLHQMLSKVFPVTPLSRPVARKVLLPWKGVETEGICD